MKRGLFVILAACGAGNSGTHVNLDASSGDGASQADADTCNVVLAFNPQQPIADAQATVRAEARVFGAFGVPTYTWTVQAPDGSGVATAPASTDGSQIDFVAATSGGYTVRAQVSAGTFCPDGFAVLQVAQTGAHVADYRVRVTPSPADGAPPQETIIQVLGGADVTRTLALDPGLAVTGQVKNGSTGVPAYLRFMPASSPNGYVEVFTDATGHYSTRLLGQNHTVLVVPTVAGVAPALLPWTVSTTTLNVSAGNAVTGVMKDGSGAALAGAQIQLDHDGVPSTLATTAADGSYTVRTSQPASGPFNVHVWPPAGRGLGTLYPYDVPGPTIDVRYQSLPTCDLANTPVKLGSTLEPGAHVMLVGGGAGASVGSLTSVGGLLRIPVVADVAGKLPSAVVLAGAQVRAVVDVGNGDVNVATVNTSGCSVPAIDAVAPTTVTGTLIDGNGNALVGGRIEAIPSNYDILATAGILRVEATSTANGMFSLPLAAGAEYNVTFSDPHAHSAPLTVTRVTAAGVPTTALLGKAIKLSGDVVVIGNANPVIGASIQILALTAGASDAPLAETASTETSTYAVGIPDPGTM
jgi:hypothetical protein